MTMFQLNPDAALNDTWMREFLPTIRREDMQAAFGSPSPNAFWEPERGYNGYDWFFVDDANRTVSVYERHGMFRVAASAAVDAEEVHEFIGWLGRQISR